MPGKMPNIRIYPCDAEGKIIKQSNEEIALWENKAKKTNKTYWSGKDKNSKKWVAYPVEEKTETKQ